MNEDGMLVSREWLERVDAALFGTSKANADGKRVASLFYDVRPARLESAWTQNGAGLWTATASFLPRLRSDGYRGSGRNSSDDEVFCRLEGPLGACRGSGGRFSRVDISNSYDGNGSEPYNVFTA